MNSISFDNIYLLFLAIPLIALFAVPYFVAVRKANRNGHNIASIVLHVVMAVVIAFAATNPTVTSFLTQTEVYIVADVSYSANKNLDTVDNYVYNYTHNPNLPSNYKIGLVAFGKDYQLLNGLGAPSAVKSVKEASVDVTQTDIVGALDYVGTLFSDNAIKRVVLITDGKDTDMRDSYALKYAVDRLQMQNVRVDAIFIDDNVAEGSNEVQLNYVDYTATAYLGRNETVTAVVQSGRETSAIVELYKDGKLVTRRAASLSAGLNNVTFELDTSAVGVFDYRIVVQADDEQELNNARSFTQTVTDELKVLFITESWADCTNAVERYGSKVKIDVYENDTTVNAFIKNLYINQHTGDNINIFRNNTNVPFSVEQLSVYDEIVLANVDIRKLVNYTEFITNVDVVVSSFGKSLVTMGNLGIQNRDEAELKQLEDMLPVRFGNNENDPRIYALVIDASRSMETLSHLIVAKQVAKALINLLSEDPDNEICIITFYSQAYQLQIPKKIKDFDGGLEEIYQLIDGIDGTQGTLIGNGLRSAYNALEPLNYSDKQLMLITDGLTYADETENAVDVAAEMYDSGIVTSVFDVGRQGDAQTGNVGSNPDGPSMEAKQLLIDVAAVGHGKYYYSNNLEAMDEITFGDIADNMTQSVVERDTSVVVSREHRNDKVLENIDITDLTLPDISGYVYASAKASASTVLLVQHERATSTVEKPLYAYWKYGNGRVSTFTSNFCGEWLTHWDDGVSEYFFANLLETNLPTEKHVSPFNVTVTQEGRYAAIELNPVNAHFGAQARVEVTLPDGTSVAEQMNFNANRYYLDVDVTSVGGYQINVIYSYNGNEYTDLIYYYVDYTPEYDSFAVYETSALHRALDGRGSVSLDGKLEVGNNDREVGKFTFELAVPLYVLAAVLFIVDIVVRKLKWDDVRSFLGLNKNSGEKSNEK